MMAVFAVLADPARRRILDVLREGPCSAGALVDRLGLSQSGTSKHLRVLREAGLVDVRKDAQWRVYELRPEALREVDAWLQPFRRLYATTLDALVRHLEANPDGSRPPSPPGPPPSPASPSDPPSPPDGPAPNAP